MGLSDKIFDKVESPVSSVLIFITGVLSFDKLTLFVPCRGPHHQ